MCLSWFSCLELGSVLLDFSLSGVHVFNDTCNQKSPGARAKHSKNFLRVQHTAPEKEVGIWGQGVGG